MFFSFFFFSFDFLIILPNPKQLKGTRPLDSRLLSGDFLISGSFLLPNARSQLCDSFTFGHTSLRDDVQDRRIKVL